jgi:hypothetical protein
VEEEFSELPMWVEEKRHRKFAVVEERVTRILGLTDVDSVLELWEV